MADEKTVKSRIYIRHDTEKSWTETDPVLAEGELGYSIVTGENDSGEVTTYVLKIGDGTSKWSELENSHIYYNKEDIDNLLAEIETGESNIATRVSVLEETVGTSGGGLIADIEKLQEEVEDESSGLLTIVGDENKGLVKDVSTLQNEVEDSTYGLLVVVGKEANGTEEATGLIKDIRALEDTVYTNEDKTGLQDLISANTDSIKELDEQINGSSDEDEGIVGQISALEDTVNGTSENEYADGLTSRMTVAESSISTNTANITKLQEEVEGTETTDGLLKEVEGSEAEEYKDGLLSRVSELEKTVDGDSTDNGLSSRVSTLESIVGDDEIENTLVYDVNELQTNLSSLTTFVGTKSTETVEATGIVKDIENNTADIETINSTIDNLDYDSSSVEGDYVDKVTQANGHVEVTKKAFDDSITATSTNVVTAQGIYNTIKGYENTNGEYVEGWLDNYYDKNDIDKIIIGMQQLQFKVVETLPTIGEAYTFYFVPSDENEHIFDAYYWDVETNGWIETGAAKWELEGYVTNSELTDRVKELLVDGSSDGKFVQKIAYDNNENKFSATTAAVPEYTLSITDNVSTKAENEYTVTTVALQKDSTNVANSSFTLGTAAEKDTSEFASADDYTTLSGQVSTLETTVGDSNSGLVKKVTDLENADYLTSVPVANTDTVGGFKTGYSEANSGTSANRMYAVKINTEDEANTAYVNVPWTDTTYTVADDSSNPNTTNVVTNVAQSGTTITVTKANLSASDIGALTSSDIETSVTASSTNDKAAGAKAVYDCVNGITIPTITLNNTSTATPSFFAPISNADTSGSVLTSVVTTEDVVPTWTAQNDLSVGIATKLETGRTLRVNLANTNASTAFDGTANIADIGVSGSLPYTSVSGLGAAATCGTTSDVTDNSTDLVTSGAVYTAINNVSVDITPATTSTLGGVKVSSATTSATNGGTYENYPITIDSSNVIHAELWLANDDDVATLFTA